MSLRKPCSKCGEWKTRGCFLLADGDVSDVCATCDDPVDPDVRSMSRKDLEAEVRRLRTLSRIV